MIWYDNHMIWFDILVACNDSIYQYDMIAVMIAYQYDITNQQVMISIIVWYDISMIYFWYDNIIIW